jgi:hypothetical protein
MNIYECPQVLGLDSDPVQHSKPELVVRHAPSEDRQAASTTQSWKMTQQLHDAAIETASDSMDHDNHNGKEVGESWAVIVAGDEGDRYELYNLDKVSNLQCCFLNCCTCLVVVLGTHALLHLCTLQYT